MRFIVLSFFVWVMESGFVSLSAQENLLVQFGRPLPSVSTDGKLVQFEDQKSQLLVEVFRVLPPSADLLSSFVIIESVFTTNGVPTGRRLSLFPLSEEVTPASNASRIASLDFDVWDRFESITFNKHPSTWINLANMPEERRVGDFYNFLKTILDPLLAMEKFPLNKAVTAADLDMASVPAPRGLLSPQVIRPIYGLEAVGEDVTQTVLTQIERRYSPESVLTKMEVRVFHLLSHVGTLEVTHRQALAVGHDFFVHQTESTSSPLLQGAKPCRKILSLLKEHEGARK